MNVARPVTCRRNERYQARYAEAPPTRRSSTSLLARNSESGKRIQPKSC